MTRKLDYILITLLCVVWGSTWLVIKVGVEEVPPLLFAGYRMVAAVAVLYLIFKFLNLKFTVDWIFYKYNLLAAASGYLFS